MKVLLISTKLNIRERVLSYLLINDNYTVDLLLNTESESSKSETLFSNKKLKVRKDFLNIKKLENLLDNALLKYDFIILYSDLIDLSELSKLPLSRKQNKTKSILYFIQNKENTLTTNNDLFYLSQSGLLNNLNWFNSHPIDKEYHIPKNHFIIEIVLNCFLVASIVNFRSLNKEGEGSEIETIDTLDNIAYYLNSAYNLNDLERLKKIEESGYFPGFDKEHYNVFKSKDNYFFNLGNLEKKFRDDFISNLPKEYLNKQYNFDVIKEICENNTIDFLEKKFVNDKNCSSPVLDIEEAKDLHKHFSTKQIKTKEMCDIQLFLLGKRENINLTTKF